MSPALPSQPLPLRSFDRHLTAALRRGIIHLISVQFLLEQPEGYKLPRMQELQVHGGALLTPEQAATLLWRADRSIFVHSYGCACRAFSYTHLM